MNITKENTDALNATIKVKIEQPDYEERVNKVLKDYRKKANFKGFRPGKVPMGMINKMYRVPVMTEEINKILSESLMKYIVDEKLDILGEPLPSENQQSKIDFESDTDFEFTFDIGLSPNVDFSISKKDKIPFYKIKIDDKLRKEATENITKRFGEFKPADKVSDMDELIKGSLVQLDSDGNIIEGGIFVDENSLSVDMIKDDSIKKKFKGAKAGDTITLDIKKAYPNDAELSSLLKIEKEEVTNMAPDFKVTINEVQKYHEAELNEELFEKVYGKDNVKTKEEFKAKVEEELRNTLDQEAEYRFVIDVRDTMIKKIKGDLPSEFLKRWIKATNEKVTEEQLDKDFPEFEKDLRWQLFKNKIVKDNDIQVNDEELLESAKEYALMQFRQYGLPSVPDEHLIPYAKQLLEKDDERRKLAERKLEEKVIAHLKENIKVEDKEISREKFNKLYEK